ncbi:MAG: hypothetical protein HKM07_07770 [Chlamydiae bacterium]|nr:hypothetical protein [Chlamydiota bacterium]
MSANNSIHKTLTPSQQASLKEGLCSFGRNLVHSKPVRTINLERKFFGLPLSGSVSLPLDDKVVDLEVFLGTSTADTTSFEGSKKPSLKMVAAQWKKVAYKTQEEKEKLVETALRSDPSQAEKLRRDLAYIEVAADTLYNQWVFNHLKSALLAKASAFVSSTPFINPTTYEEIEINAEMKILIETLYSYTRSGETLTADSWIVNLLLPNYTKEEREIILDYMYAKQEPVDVDASYTAFMMYVGNPDNYRLEVVKKNGHKFLKAIELHPLQKIARFFYDPMDWDAIGSVFSSPRAQKQLQKHLEKTNQSLLTPAHYEAVADFTAQKKSEMEKLAAVEAHEEKLDRLTEQTIEEAEGKASLDDTDSEAILTQIKEVYRTKVELNEAVVMESEDIEEKAFAFSKALLALAIHTSTYIAINTITVQLPYLREDAKEHSTTANVYGSAQRKARIQALEQEATRKGIHISALDHTRPLVKTDEASTEELCTSLSGSWNQFAEKIRPVTPGAASVLRQMAQQLRSPETVAEMTEVDVQEGFDPRIESSEEPMMAAITPQAQTPRLPGQKSETLTRSLYVFGRDLGQKKPNPTLNTERKVFGFFRSESDSLVLPVEDNVVNLEQLLQDQGLLPTSEEPLSIETVAEMWTAVTCKDKKTKAGLLDAALKRDSSDAQRLLYQLDYIEVASNTLLNQWSFNRLRKPMLAKARSFIQGLHFDNPSSYKESEIDSELSNLIDVLYKFASSDKKISTDSWIMNVLLPNYTQEERQDILDYMYAKKEPVNMDMSFQALSKFNRFPGQYKLEVMTNIHGEKYLRATSLSELEQVTQFFFEPTDWKEVGRILSNPYVRNQLEAKLNQTGNLDADLQMFRTLKELQLDVEWYTDHAFERGKVDDWHNETALARELAELEDEFNELISKPQEEVVGEDVLRIVQLGAAMNEKKKQIIASAPEGYVKALEKANRKLERFIERHNFASHEIKDVDTMIRTLELKLKGQLPKDVMERRWNFLAGKIKPFAPATGHMISHVTTMISRVMGTVVEDDASQADGVSMRAQDDCDEYAASLQEDALYDEEDPSNDRHRMDPADVSMDPIAERQAVLDGQPVVEELVV